MNPGDRPQQKLKGRALNALILAAFSDYLNGRSYSPLTLEAYSRQLRRFATFLSVNMKKGLHQAKRRDVAAFLKYKRQRGVVERSLAQLVSILRHFNKYLLRGGYSRRNPMTRIACPRQLKPLPRALNKTEINLFVQKKTTALANSVSTIERALVARDRAILMLLYAGALRPSELLALSLQDVAIFDNHGSMVVRGERHRQIRFSDVSPA